MWSNKSCLELGGQATLQAHVLPQLSVFNAQQHSQCRLSPSRHQLCPYLKERSGSVQCTVVKVPILTLIAVQGMFLQVVLPWKVAHESLDSIRQAIF